MTSRYASAALGAVCLAAMVLPAAGADVIYRGSGSMKDVGGPIGVPVPAPVPVPDYKSGWYFRADIGGGFLQEPDISERGLVYGLSDGTRFGAATTFGTDSFLNFSLDSNAIFTGGVGVGYYFSQRLRGDLIVDLRSESQFNSVGSYSYTEVDPPGTNTVFGTAEEQVKLRGTVGLANIYYDLFSQGQFKPYIGAGIGFVLNEVTRRHQTNERVVDPVGPSQVAQRAFSAPDSTHQVFNLAAAAMAGFTYHLYDNVSLDVNYRYLFMGGPSITEAINGQMSTLTIGDMHEHQIRAGFRYNID